MVRATGPIISIGRLFHTAHHELRVTEHLLDAVTLENDATHVAIVQVNAEK